MNQPTEDRFKRLEEEQKNLREEVRQLRIPYLWLRVGFMKQEFQAQFLVTKSGTLREGYSIRFSEVKRHPIAYKE